MTRSTVRRRMRFHDLAIDRPDEGRQLAGDRRGDDGRPLTLPGERPKTSAQPHLRFPGNLAHRPRCCRHLNLLLAANTWRMPIAPSGFDQDTPRPTIASLGDAAAVDRVARGAFRGYETEIPHQLAGILKARQIADLGQHRHCRNEIYPAHRLQGCDELGKGPLGHRVTDRLLQASMDYNFSNLLSYNNGLVNKAVSSVTQGVQNSLSETVLTHPSHPCLTCRQADRQRIRTVKRFRRCLALVCASRRRSNQSGGVSRASGASNCTTSCTGGSGAICCPGSGGAIALSLGWM